MVIVRLNRKRDVRGLKEPSLSLHNEAHYRSQLPFTRYGQGIEMVGTAEKVIRATGLSGPITTFGKT